MSDVSAPAISMTSQVLQRTNTRYCAPFYRWRVVLAAAIGLFWGVPVTVYSFTAFLKPLTSGFHAGRAAVSLAITLHLIAGALSAPLAGWLTDHYGARKVILPATAVFGALLLSNKAFSGSLFHLYIFFAALGFVISGVGPIPYGNVVSHWFDRRRGLALGLMMVGIGVGAMVMPVFAQQLIARFGWQSAYAILGAAVLLISLPITATFIRQKPQDSGLFPDQEVPGNSSSGTDAGVRGASLREAWHTRTFWVLVCAFFLVSGSVQGCFVHLAAMLTDRGASAQTAVFGSSVAGAAVLTGRALTGYLLDLLFAPRVAAIFFCVAALGIALLWIGTTSVAFAGGIFVGLGLGAEVDIIAYLTGSLFRLACIRPDLCLRVRRLRAGRCSGSSHHGHRLRSDGLLSPATYRISCSNYGGCCADFLPGAISLFRQRAKRIR